MWKFKASKYKNAAPKIPKREEWLSDLPVGGHLQGWGNHIKASAQFMVFNVDSSGGGNVGILPLDARGRTHRNDPVIQAHSEFVTDFDFSPFDDYLLATGSMDCTVKLWTIPDGGLTENIVSPQLQLASEDKKVENVLWHPTAADILAISSAKTVKVYDITAKQAVYSGDVQKEQVHSISWKGDGSLMVTSGRDKMIRVLDPRQNKVAKEASGHQNIKDSRVLWLGSTNYIITTGFDQMRSREVKLRDMRNLSDSLKTQSLDTSSGVLMPFYDPDTKMMFMAGKGDTCVRYQEISEEDPYITEGMNDTVEQIKGMAMVPKRAMDVMSCEVNRLLLLTNHAIVNIPYHVPRKSYNEYHGDLYPDTASGDPAMSAEEWIDGAKKQVKLMNLDPSKRSGPVSKKMTEPVGTKITPSRPPPKSPRETTPEPSGEDTLNQMRAKLKKVQVQSPAAADNGHAEPVQQETSILREKKHKPFAGVRHSKFRHLKGSVLHKDHHITNLRNLSKSIPGESDMFHANVDRCAVPLGISGGLVAVFELSKPGRLPDTGVPALQNGSAIMDFVFDPFDNSRIAIGCDDAKIKIWNIPNGGLTETLTEPDMQLKGHTEKLYLLRYHPLAKDILVSASYDMTVRIWDVGTGQELVSLEGHTDTVFSAAWSPDGKKLATVCKDGKIRIYDPRKSTEPILTGAGPPGSRGARIIWVCDGARLVVTGFDRSSNRTVAIYDPASLGRPLHSEDLGVSPSILVPFYDEDSTTLFATGRGDRMVYAYETLEDAPHLVPLTHYSETTLHQALSFLPKCHLDIRSVEFAKAWKLTQTTIEPVSFTVPRIKNEYFQDDLFPETRETWKPVMTAEEWWSGLNRAVKRISLRPSDMQKLSEAPVEAPKPKKFESYNRETFKTDKEKQAELVGAMNAKLENRDDQPLPQDLTEGVDEDEWDD